MLTPEELAALESHVTTTEAAERVRRTPAAIRQWVKRGHLKPINPDMAGPKYYRVVDVLRCDRDRRAKIMELLSA
jgi:DNA-binding transcriptional MerR regulator